MFRDIGPQARRLMTGVAASALGDGLVFPFLLVYLHQVRGLPLPVVGAILAAPGLVGLVSTPVAGALVDRIGAVRVIAGALLLQAAGTVGLIFVRNATEAVVAVALTGLGMAAVWPASQSLIVALVPGPLRQRYFGVQFTLLNLGFGLGGAAGAAFVSVAHPWSFAAIFAVDAATFAVYLILLATLRGAAPPGGAGAAAPGGAGRPRRDGYRVVLADRRFRKFMLVNLVLVTIGYGQIDSGFPAFVTGPAHLPARVVGLAFTANTATIVVTQLLVLRRLDGRRRTRIIAAVAGVWAAAWLVLGAAGLLPGATAAAVLAVGSLAVFGLGETLLSPVGPALTNDLAPDSLRGRYNAAASLAWTCGQVAGPVLGAGLIGAGASVGWLALLVAGAAATAVLVVRLEPHLNDAQNGLVAPAPMRAVEQSVTLERR